MNPRKKNSPLKEKNLPFKKKNPRAMIIKKHPRKKYLMNH